MAHKDSAPQGAKAAGSPGGHAAPPAGTAHAAPSHDAHAHAHPTWKQYKWVALILTGDHRRRSVDLLHPVASSRRKLFVPSLLIMSAVKFAIVVMFYMHLKYDARLFRALFTGPLIIAVVTIISLLFLFGHLSVRLGS